MSSDAGFRAEGGRALGRAAFWAGCFVAPIALFALLCVLGGIYPFGPESFLTEDEKFQYVDLFTWFRRMLLGEASPFYQASIGMGGNAWGLVGYYLSSPFNVLALLFDEDHLVGFFWLMTALKLGCVQVSAAWYLRRRFGSSRAAAFALASCFTFSSWTASQLRNPLWLDALILLPIAAYAVYLLVRDARWVPLAVVLAVEVVVCWYTAYMTIIFLALFAVVELVAVSGEGVGLGARFVGRRVASFALAVAVAVALAAFTFAPSVAAQLGSSGGVGLTSLRMTTVKGFAQGFLVGGWVDGESPQHFAGALVAILAVAFAVAGRIPRRVRVAAIALLAFMLASSYLTPLLYVWSGFRMPSGFYCRITFFTVFLAVWMAGCAWRALVSGPSARPSIVKAAAGVALLACLAVVAGLFTRLADGLVALVAVGVSAAALTVLVRRPSGSRAHVLAAAVLCACVFGELAYGAHFAWNQLYLGYPQEQHEAYVASSRAQLAELEESDPGLYRIDKTYTRAGEAALNEALARDYLALSTYISSQDIAAVNMLNALGYSKEGPFSTRYAVPVLVTDSLFGVRYASSTDRPVGFEDTGLMPVEAPGFGTARFYRNPYALPLGFGVAPSADGFALAADENPFERQNALASALAGEEVALYRAIQPVSVSGEGDRVAYTVDVPAGDIGYVYVSSDVEREVLLVLDGGNPIRENQYWRHAVTPLGDARASDTAHEVSVVAEKGAEGESASPLDASSCVFYALDVGAFESFVERLGSSACEFTTFEPGHIEAVYRAESDGFLLVSIPDTPGWSAVVNGEGVETGSACEGGLMLVPVKDGENVVELDFTPPGLVAGCAVSAVAVAALLAGVLVSRRKRRV